MVLYDRNADAAANARAAGGERIDVAQKCEHGAAFARRGAHRARLESVWRRVELQGIYRLHPKRRVDQAHEQKS